VKNIESAYGWPKKGAAFVLVTVAAIAGFTVSGCGTIIHGTRQGVGISSAPTGAQVWIDNVKMGETPVIAKLRRKDTHTVRLILPGYQPYETTITRNVSGWVWGNIVIGGLLGLGVDAISGGMYKLSPGQVSGSLAAEHAAGSSKTDEIYVDVVMKPQRDWELIGQLQKGR
jgi:uncharacterized protein YceK